MAKAGRGGVNSVQGQERSLCAGDTISKSELFKLGEDLGSAGQWQSPTPLYQHGPKISHLFTSLPGTVGVIISALLILQNRLAMAIR